MFTNIIILPHIDFIHFQLIMILFINFLIFNAKVFNFPNYSMTAPIKI